MELDESVEFPDRGAFRAHYNDMGELYSIMRATEHLETAFVMDVLPVKAYTQACDK